MIYNILTAAAARQAAIEFSFNKPVYSLPIHGFKNSNYHTLTLDYKLLNVMKKRWVFYTLRAYKEIMGGRK